MWGQINSGNDFFQELDLRSHIHPDGTPGFLVAWWYLEGKLCRFVRVPLGFW